jgi:hypothetical protein
MLRRQLERGLLQRLLLTPFVDRILIEEDLTRETCVVRLQTRITASIRASAVPACELVCLLHVDALGAALLFPCLADYQSGCNKSLRQFP